MRSAYGATFWLQISLQTAASRHHLPPNLKNGIVYVLVSHLHFFAGPWRRKKLISPKTGLLGQAWTLLLLYDRRSQQQEQRQGQSGQRKHALLSLHYSNQTASGESDIQTTARPGSCHCAIISTESGGCKSANFAQNRPGEISCDSSDTKSKSEAAATEICTAWHSQQWKYVLGSIWITRVQQPKHQSPFFFFFVFSSQAHVSSPIFFLSGKSLSKTSKKRVFVGVFSSRREKTWNFSSSKGDVGCSRVSAWSKNFLWNIFLCDFRVVFWCHSEVWRSDVWKN